MAVHKSDAGWRRLQARTRSHQGVRVARMDHRVKRAGNEVARASKPRADQPLVAQLEPELDREHEVHAVSWCGDCDGPCVCG